MKWLQKKDNKAPITQERIFNFMFWLTVSVVVSLALLGIFKYADFFISSFNAATGLNVTVAPEYAENITYNAFLLDGLTVAETTFRIDGITYAYRMAGTVELLDDFTDISDLNTSFGHTSAGEVFWCTAKVSFDAGGQGKVLWFDLVPGILYSLSMDSGASEEALLDMANSSTNRCSRMTATAIVRTEARSRRFRR